MDAEEILAGFIASQGWNDATVVGLLVGFVDATGQQARFKRFLEEAAKPEEEELEHG